MSSKNSRVKEVEKIVIEDYNGQKSLWNGKEESSKVTLEVRFLQIEPSITTRNFLCKFTANNYLAACSVLKLSRSKHYTVLGLDSSLESLFQEGRMKTIRLYVKYDRYSGPTFPDLVPVSLLKDVISLNIKDKDRKAILWNGKQFVYKMKFNLTDSDMMNHTLESLLKPHTALSYLLKDCSAKLLSPKYENLLTPVSMKDIVGSFVIDTSATVYLQNSGDPIISFKDEKTVTKMDLDFELVPLPSSSSLEMIDMEEIDTISKKVIKTSPTHSVSKSYNMWSKSNPDWKAIRVLIIQLERDTLTTMGYRHVSEDDRKALVDELWALNRAFKKANADIKEVLCHFNALEMVVINNQSGSSKDKSKESRKNKPKWTNIFEEDCNTKKGLCCNLPTLMRNPRKKNRPSIRLGQLAETPESKLSESLQLFKIMENKESSGMSTLKCTDCQSDVICLTCQNEKNFGTCNEEELRWFQEEELRWFQEESDHGDHIETVCIAMVLSLFVLMLVFIFFIF